MGELTSDGRVVVGVGSYSPCCAGALSAPDGKVGPDVVSRSLVSQNGCGSSETENLHHVV